MGERWYQAEGRIKIQGKWDEKKKVVLYIGPTGSGKTFLFTNIGRENEGPTLYIAHRNELVCQMSLALNMWDIQHTIITPEDVIRWICSVHHDEHGYSCYVPHARQYVAGIQTLNSQKNKWSRLLASVTLFVMDEAHHVLRENIYGGVIDMMPNARGLLATATGIRSDGKGLGRYADGVVDAVVVGPTMREIIEDGFLNDFRLLSIPTDMAYRNVPVTAKGDYSSKKLATAAQQSHIVGDVVDHYMEYGRGKLWATFVTDAVTGNKTAAKFNNAGVPAEFVTHKTSNRKRQAILKAFARREILQLVNIDLFGEGFDLPAIQGCSYAQPSQSYPRVTQQFGRPLRPMWPKHETPFDKNTREGRLAIIASSEKPHAILLDHVGNYLPGNHGVPDKKNVWDLNGRSKSEAVPLMECKNPLCRNTFEKTEDVCPYCGWAPKVRTPRIDADGPASPVEVDGRLRDLDPDSRERLEAAARAAVKSPDAYRKWLKNGPCPERFIERNVRLHQRKIAHQEALRSIMTLWVKRCAAQGWGETEAQQRFYYKFGIDMLSAQSLDLKGTESLVNRVVMEGFA